jgi:hypothetical protein
MAAMAPALPPPIIRMSACMTGKSGFIRYSLL